MTEAAQKLEIFILQSQPSRDRSSKAIPRERCPRATELRHLIFTSAALLPLQPFLSSVTSLVSTQIVSERIPSFAYFHLTVSFQVENVSFLRAEWRIELFPHEYGRLA